MHRYVDVSMVSDTVVARIRVKRGATVSTPIALAQTTVSLINCFISQLLCQDAGLREDTKRVRKS